VPQANAVKACGECAIEVYAASRRAGSENSQVLAFTARGDADDQSPCGVPHLARFAPARLGPVVARRCGPARLLAVFMQPTLVSVDKGPMMIEHRFMSWWNAALVVIVLASGCTKPNPKSCQDGTCTDPAFPFCDVDGALAGEAETCIAVACTANEFVACRGDRAITCNTTGTDYELERCDGGCAEAAGGCRLCDPNETVCENGRVQTCDANGAVVASEACALGCFEDQPRCRRIDPSNALGAYLDMVATPPNLDLEDAVILTETGEITEAGVPVTGIPTFLVPASVGGVPIRVFIVQDLKLANVKVFAMEIETTGYPVRTGPALAIVAIGTIKITGRVTVSGGAGGLVSPGCSGGPGVPGFDDINRGLYPGAGGGGHATAGASGAEIRNRYAGGVGGGLSGTENLSPLRGGCPGGGSGGAGSLGSPGGGALQLSSQKAIEVSAVIDARGTTLTSLTGGGAGGGLLLEGATITFKADARLIAIGGAGGSGGPGPNPVVLSDDGLPQGGITCEPTSAYCGNGGSGAAAGIPASPGVSATASTNQLGDVAGGGGGGGLGRIRINTPDRTYVKANSVVEAGATSVGTLSTR